MRHHFILAAAGRRGKALVVPTICQRKSTTGLDFRFSIEDEFY
jgi:hypothetical protein